ncbi:MAG: Trk system potassium transporter TrkA [Corallococcus sp.]|nr:Trk system potassium transporter TrkA [Corallococcus sp.]MCM1358939.1 Trk system potassium transporter TrkA [Corallococcus sp.]MCM1394927.1 Trk system potassium transporter TrkA [Corallococcus sp.]
MKIIVVGCGKVGKSVIESMVDEKHDIVAIDNKPDVINKVANTYDVMAVCGNATSRELLVEAGIAKTDLFLAVTASDEVNMLACFLAKKLGASHTVARIRESNYNADGLQFLSKQLELSMALNPEQLTAEHLLDFLKLPSAVKVDTFAGKKIQILEMILRENSRLAGVALSDLRKKCPVNFIVCAVKRGEETFVPKGAFSLEEGDKVAFMVKRSDAHKFLRAIGIVQKQGRDVMILGGSATSYYLTKLLAANNYSVKIIERDKARCAQIAEIVPSGATIICGDGMSQDLLWEEGIKSTDAFVALTGEDEENILTSFYALSQQVPKVVTKVNRNELANLAEKLGLDCMVSPQKIVADVLTRYARALNNSLESKVETLYRLLDGDAEALEFIALSDCKLIGIPLKDLDLKENLIIAGIIRDRESIIPGGDDVILQGDRVIVVAAELHLNDLSDVSR